ncbi:MAG: glycosyltransferase family 4 protein, partial [Microbacteriaceae bacterium]
VDQIVSPIPGGIGRYTEELTRALIRTAPAGCSVEGIVSASPEADYAKIHTLLPGLSRLHKSVLARRELSFAWRYGLSRLPGGGMVHATSLLAPLSRHDRAQTPGNQTVVTIHDAIPWTHPETLTAHSAAWHRAMGARARKFADAIVVPTHAVAEQLGEIMDVGDRIRVIGGAASSKFSKPVDAAARARRMKLPRRYLLTLGTLEPRKGIAPLIASLADPALRRIPLLIAGPAGWGDLDVAAIAAEAGLAEGRVRTLGHLSDADLAVALDRATVFVYPSLAEGFGLPVIEAFHCGTPVVHSDDPALVEVAGGAGLAVPRVDLAGYPARLATAISRVLKDADLAERMSTSGLDRSKVFSWLGSAEKVWQLHADL